jgi:acetyltransferase
VPGPSAPCSGAGHGIAPTPVILAGSDPATLRAVDRDDGPALQRFFEQMTPDDVRKRFFAPLEELPDGHLARLLDLDPERELALVLDRGGEILAIARIADDAAVPLRAEFAVTVRSDLQGQRIGSYMVGRLIDFARAHGVKEIYGDILADNTAMIAMAQDLGFAVAPLAETAAIVRATRRL